MNQEAQADLSCSLGGEICPHSSADPLARALAHRAAAVARLTEQLDDRVAVLRHALSRSRVPQLAAELSRRLDGLLHKGRPGDGPGFLQLTRELVGLERTLAQAESRVDQDQREAQQALGEAGQHLAQVAPGLARTILPLLFDLPADPQLSERVPALLSLLRARQHIVPHLAAARSPWRR